MHSPQWESIFFLCLHTCISAPVHCDAKLSSTYLQCVISAGARTIGRFGQLSSLLHIANFGPAEHSRTAVPARYRGVHYRQNHASSACSITQPRPQLFVELQADLDQHIDTNHLLGLVPGVVARQCSEPDSATRRHAPHGFVAPVRSSKRPIYIRK